jgi:hypothetical protein
LVIQECIQAIKDAKEDHVHTSFDKGMVGGTKQRCVTSIKERFSL